MSATLERRLARLAGRFAAPAPAAPPSPVAMAEALGLALDPWQRDVLTTDARQVLLLCSRQAGKSTIAALLGLHVAVYRPGSLVLVLSPGERQSGRLFRTIARFYGALGSPVAAAVENRLSLELRNGSEVHALPGTEATVRGFAGAALLVVDEAARVPDALYQAARPMLAVSQGRVLALSTPFGKRGWFWAEWETGGPAWHRIKVTAEQVPRIPADWLAQERARIGAWWFAQEYGCEFVDADDQVFATELVMRALSPDVEPLFA